MRFHNKSVVIDAVQLNEALRDVTVLDDVDFPPGYCLDPNGVMCTPADSAPHYDFGYEVGFREAMAIKMGAIDKYVDAAIERLVNEGMKGWGP